MENVQRSVMLLRPDAHIMGQWDSGATLKLQALPGGGLNLSLKTAGHTGNEGTLALFLRGGTSVPAGEVTGRVAAGKRRRRAPFRCAGSGCDLSGALRTQIRGPGLALADRPLSLRGNAAQRSARRGAGSRTGAEYPAAAGSKATGGSTAVAGGDIGAGGSTAGVRAAAGGSARGVVAGGSARGVAAGGDRTKKKYRRKATSRLKDKRRDSGPICRIPEATRNIPTPTPGRRRIASRKRSARAVFGGITSTPSPARFRAATGSRYPTPAPRDGGTTYSGMSASTQSTRTSSAYRANTAWRRPYGWTVFPPG